MKKIIVLSFYLFQVFLCEVCGKDEVKSSENLIRDKRQDDRWSWGSESVSDMTTTPKQVLARQSTQNSSQEETPCTKYENYKPQLPNFSTGRRKSEQMCLEYIWQMKTKVTTDDLSWNCTTYNLMKHPDNKKFAVGGRNTEFGEFPHMVSKVRTQSENIMVRDPLKKYPYNKLLFISGAIGWKASVGTWIFKCGSSLISPKFVLTAAHCSRASNRDTSISDTVPKIVRLGDKNILDVFVNSRSPTDADISRIIVHPQYAAPKKYFDIALMELQKEVKFSFLVQPACLWSKADTSSLGTKATLTGWGVVETAGRTTSPELQAADVDIIDSQTCNKFLMPSCNRNWCGIQDHQLCAGKLAGGVDACQGDSGGPLQVRISLPKNVQTRYPGVHYIIGVTSFGIGCAVENLPGIYTRVSSFIDWIESIVWN